MQPISVFDMMKIGVGPSSSHTMGPWQAARRFLESAVEDMTEITSIRVDLYGSLAKTGKGHGTDIAVMMGLLGEDPATCDTAQIGRIVQHIRDSHEIDLLGRRLIPFDAEMDIVFHHDETLPFHPNGIRLTAMLDDGSMITETYYSVGGGFIIREGETPASDDVRLPFCCEQAEDVEDYCAVHDLAIWQMVLENEKAWRDEPTIRHQLLHIWETMADCVYRGCHTAGQLPGGLGVIRRAHEVNRKLVGMARYDSRDEWMAQIRAGSYSFEEIIKWVSCFALAVNEENAAFGRVVTAPTNGAAGVIPAVLLYYVCFHGADDDAIIRFLLVAGEIGSLFKKGATISAAMGGCQAEIGVSSAMAAAALTECRGGSVAQALMAAEIAMEHHLGMTCDPVGGLVQIPCIERNAMGAMKAITAANIALESSPEFAKVSLDAVIKTMWATAQDMNVRYKETAEGGLAVSIPVNLAEC